MDMGVKSKLKTLTIIVILNALILMFQSCGPAFESKKSDMPNVMTDPVFYPYIQEFEFLNKKSVGHIPVSFADLDGDIAGLCHRITFDGKTVYAYIEISRDYWPRATELQKINLIFHEFGHCALNRDHVEPDGVRLCPTSFMHYQIMSERCLSENYSEYMQEMFNGPN